MNYTLYNRKGSAGLAIEAILQYAELPHKLVEIESLVNSPLPDAFRDVNPWGQVPVLILPSGETVTEAAAMIIHLAAQHPDKPIGPAPATAEFARFARWVVFASVNIHEGVSRQIYPFRFTTDKEAETSVAQAATVRLHRALETLEQGLAQGPFLHDAAFSGAEIYFAMFYQWSGQNFDLPRLRDVHQKVSEHPVIRPVWERHFGD